MSLLGGIFGSIFNSSSGSNRPRNSTVTTTTPWGPQGAFATSIWNKAGSIYDQGQPFVGQGGVTRSALYGINSLARQDNPLLSRGMGAYDQIASGRQRVTTGDEFGQQYGQMQRPGMLMGGNFDAIADGRRQIGTGNMFRGIYGQAGGSSELDGGMYDRVASGGMVGANPYHEANIKTMRDNAANAIKASMSSAGRYGSGAYGAAMAKGLGEVETGYRANMYEADMGRMMQGAQAQEQARQGRMGIGLSAAQGLTGVRQGDISNQMGAAQAQSAEALARSQQGLSALQGQTQAEQLNIGNRLTANEQLPMLQDMRYNDLGRQLSAGQMFDQNAQEYAQHPWSQLNKLAGYSSVLPGSFNTQQTQQPAPNPWMQALNLGMAGWNMFNPMGA